MASGPTSSQTEDENVKTVTDFVFLGSKITAGGHCSYEVKRSLLLGRKAMKNPDSILKSRNITLPTNIHSENYGLSSSYVQLWELDHKEGREPKNLWLYLLCHIPLFYVNDCSAVNYYLGVFMGAGELMFYSAILSESKFNAGILQRLNLLRISQC